MYERFKELCDERGVSIYAVSKDTGILQSSFSDWKAGRYKLSPKRMKLLADYFGVSVAYLNGTSDRRTPFTGAAGAPTENDIKVALFGGDCEVTDEMWDEVHRYAQYLKEKLGK